MIPMISVVEIVDALSRGILATLEVTLGAFGLGLLLAVPVAVARLAHFAPVRYAAISYIDLFRGIPPIALLFVIYFGIAQVFIAIPSLPAAIIGLGIVASAYIAEIYRAGVQSVAKGQWEASQAIGLSPSRAVRLVIVPQAILVVLPPTATFALGLLKDSALASIIGANEIAFRAHALTQRTGAGLVILSVAAGIYIALSVPLAVAVRWIDNRLTTYTRT
jgi:polar amino acid transport system permease protein